MGRIWYIEITISYRFQKINFLPVKCLPLIIEFKLPPFDWRFLPFNRDQSNPQSDDHHDIWSDFFCRFPRSQKNSFKAVLISFFQLNINGLFVEAFVSFSSLFFIAVFSFSSSILLIVTLTTFKIWFKKFSCFIIEILITYFYFFAYSHTFLAWSLIKFPNSFKASNSFLISKASFILYVNWKRVCFRPTFKDKF